jgi:NADPH:quinone reductase
MRCVYFTFMADGKGRAHHGYILHEAARLVEAGKLRPLLNAKGFTLETVSEAHLAVESGDTVGKVVVDVRAG